MNDNFVVDEPAVSVVLPAVCNGTTLANPHITLLYAGPLSEQSASLDDVMNSVDLSVASVPEYVIVTGIDFFGEDNDILVAITETPLLHQLRNKVLIEFENLLEDASSFDEYTPHVSLMKDIDEEPLERAYSVGQLVYLSRPQLWWGDLRFNL